MKPLLITGVIAALIATTLTTTFASESSTLSRRNAALLLSNSIPIPHPTTSGSFQYTDIHEQDAEMIKEYCTIEALDCNLELFNGNQEITPEAFLKLLLLRVQAAHGKYALPVYHAYTQYWWQPYAEAAERSNLLPENFFDRPLTEEKALEVLKRLALLEEFEFIPPFYSQYLEIPNNKVTLDHFKSIQAVQKHIEEVQTIINIAEGRAQSSWVHSAYAAKLTLEMKDRAKRLQQLLSTMLQHSLWYDESYPEEDRAVFQSLGLYEVIGEGYYDFRNNASYRKTNVRNSIDNVHKVVLEPGEEFNYWKTMYDVGLSDIVNGWIISGGKEVWAWGGGLCGTATAIFRGAWFAGLDITERKNHSIYYNSLYDPTLIGLDAAVYSTSPNLRFTNNTGAPLMIYLKWNETKDEVWVQMLGTKTFKDLSSSGMYRDGSAYAHTRTITYDDGTTSQDTVKSWYRAIH